MIPESRPTTIAVDAVGGDFAPSEILAGVSLALDQDPTLSVALVGPNEIVSGYAASRDGRVLAVPAAEIIGMDEHPANAVRSKKDSSIVVGCRLVKDGRADAFFSAGSTGAMMAASTLVVGRIPGVMRPAIATVLPSAGAPVVLLDVGANADCKPEYLLQFAHMGAAYSTAVLGVEHPRISLLNIGEESSKGSLLAQETHALMAEQVPGFAGNIEGREILKGVTDVIVTDGFTGNVALKLLEGTSEVLLAQVRAAMTSSPVRSIAASVLRPGMRELKHRLDPDAYGGAPLLGVNGVCIIGHGSSNAAAVQSAIRVSAQAVRAGLTERIRESLS